MSSVLHTFLLVKLGKACYKQQKAAWFLPFISTYGLRMSKEKTGYCASYLCHISREGFLLV